MILELAVGLVLLAVLAIFLFKAPSHAPGLPTPPPSFFLGHYYHIDKNFDILQDWLLAQTKLFKWKTWGLTAPRLGSFSRWGGGIVISSPENVEHVLKTAFKKYEKTDMLTATLNELLGNGIFTSDNELWKFHRKVAVGMFSKRLLDNGTSLAMKEAQKLVVKLDECARTKTPVDLQKCFYAFTMDVFAQLAFGVEFNSQKTDHPFTVAFDTCQFICQNRFNRPLWKLQKLFQLSQDERDLAKAKVVVKRFAEEVINTKRREVENNGRKSLGPDLISRFLDGAIQRNQEITNKELTDVVLNFIIAGRDTTAAALSWTMFELLQHSPASLETARESITKATQGKPVQGMESSDVFELINSGKLAYLKAVLSEGLRLHPSVAKDLKFAVEDDILPDGTAVKTGMCVFYSPYIMGRNPHIWKKDPLKFDPGRWVTTTGDGGSLFKPTQEISDYAYAVFNAGKRLCLGRPLAYLEMQLILSILLPRYEFTPVKEHDGSYTQTIVAPMKGGFHVHVKRR